MGVVPFSQDITFRKILHFAIYNISQDSKREKDNLAKCNIWPNDKSCEMAKSCQKAKSCEMAKKSINGTKQMK